MLKKFIVDFHFGPLILNIKLNTSSSMKLDLFVIEADLKFIEVEVCDL